ncbi:MAG: 1-deoxy-D-xylulose-5-phosphate synthase [Candidatus Marinimicrobia bacterium]|nr:1-deoxy-D-xylulose-5-phosphate synthase [Candidatus Neomarinimicrobiota bacterium]
MKKNILSQINSPTDLKNLNSDALDNLSGEVANHIKRVIEEHGGHYSSPLGVVDLSIALHYVYDSPKDKIIWDVGHQAYAHKILTGRRDQFHTLRQKDGISGFLKRSESKHDIVGAGHASTSISSALGFAHARDKDKTDDQIVSIIGDGAMTGGLAYEGINNLGYHKTQMTIVLNDNSMSISESVGALSRYLNRVVTNPTYNRIRNDIWDLSGKIPMSSFVRKFLRKTEEGIKGFLTPGALFEELGLRYIGPVDGHDLDELIRTFESVKQMNTPVLVHVYTKKGKGSANAESDSVKFYSMSGSKNKVSHTKKPVASYSQAFGESIAQIAENDDAIECVTAAMEIGTGMTAFTKKFPDKYIDVGIAEEHAVTYASGLAGAGKKPIVAIYSTFLQRAFDCIFHDGLLQDLPIIYCMDRAGLVGPDGPTHHGVFDIPMLRMLPNMIVTAPKDGNELKNLLATATASRKSFSIRYPKSSSRNFDKSRTPELLKIGEWEKLNSGDKVAILATGSMVAIVEDNLDFISKGVGFAPTLINARFIKPLDTPMLSSLSKKYDAIITMEEGCLAGGFGSAVIEYFNDIGSKINVSRMGIPDNFIEHGTRKELLDSLNLNANGVISNIKVILGAINE